MTEPLQQDDPQQLGRYRLSGLLGRGGMGTVYLGHDEQGQQVAVKVINPALASNPHFRERFRREVDAAGRVRPFCTAPVLDASLDGHPLYVVSEYIAGPTLADAVADSGPLQNSDLAGLAVGVATALAAIHDTGIIHRDLKPSNVLLSGVGPRVIDFGIAKAHAETSLTHSGQIVGTPAYQAPELLTGGPVTPASDVFSWGCVMAFAGTGRDPFSGNSLSEVAYSVANKPPHLDGFSPALLEIVSQALSKNPHARPSVSHLLRELAGRTDHHHAQSHYAPPSQPPPGGNAGNVHDSTKGRRRNSLWLIGIAAPVIAVAVAFLVVGVVLSRGDAEQSANGNLPHESTPAASTSPTGASAPEPPVPGEQTSETPSEPGDVPRHFLGRWTGLITHHATKDKEFSAVLTISGGKLAQKVGESEYSSTGCRGTLKLVSATDTKLVVEEHIYEGKESCSDVVFITLTYQEPRALGYKYKLTNTHGAGTLRPA